MGKWSFGITTAKMTRGLVNHIHNELEAWPNKAAAIENSSNWIVFFSFSGRADNYIAVNNHWHSNASCGQFPILFFRFIENISVFFSRSLCGIFMAIISTIDFDFGRLFIIISFFLRPELGGVRICACDWSTLFISTMSYWNTRIFNCLATSSKGSARGVYKCEWNICCSFSLWAFA